VPLARMLQLSLFDPAFTLAHYAEFLGTGTYMRVMLNTVILAFNVSGICLVLGYPVAYAITSTPPRTRRLFLIPVMLPYLTSLMVRTYAWMVLLGTNGMVNGFLSLLGLGPYKLMNNSLGVYIGMVHVLLPLMILPICNAMQSIDMRLVHAAEGLGATRWQAFVRVFAPLSLPGVAAGTCLVFIIALGFFVTPALLGALENMTVSMLIENQVGVALNWGFAAAIGMVLLIATMATLALAMLAVKAAGRTMASGGVRLLGSA
jgi:putative spermidine/putrescine transport system permease protein